MLLRTHKKLQEIRFDIGIEWYPGTLPKNRADMKIKAAANNTVGFLDCKH